MLELLPLRQNFTGSYTLQHVQANRARFNQYDVNATCIVCKQEPEGREHFLLRCEGLADTRKIYIDMLKDNIYAYYDMTHRLGMHSLVMKTTFYSASWTVPNVRF